MIGGFFDKHHAIWDEAQCDWFEALLEEDDVHVMAWAMNVEPAPERYEGPMMEAMRRLDYVHVHR